MQMHTDHEACVRAVASRDARFDGWFFTGVSSTGIYCRPSCPAMTPRAENLSFYPSAAAAQRAGFRACKRCRPDASPGSPQWSVRADVAARAMRLISDGLIDTDGVSGLASRLGYSTRQVERLLTLELGAGPLALARAQRAQTARLLIETTGLPMADVAYASGFASIRSFNEVIREVFATTPTQLRRRVSAGPVRQDGAAQSLTLRLPYRGPLHAPSLFGHLAATAVPNVEVWRAGGLERSLTLPHGHGVVHLRPGEGFVTARLLLTDLRDLTTAIYRCRAMLDLDADPVAVDAALSQDPHLAPLVAAAPGCRIPGTVDPAELALRVVLGQQVSTAAAATTTARLVAAVGTPLPEALRSEGGPTHLFPTPAQLAALTPEDSRFPGMPAARRGALLTLARALAEQRLELSPGVDRRQAVEQLSALPGLGEWSVQLIAMRGLGDPDAFPGTDLGVRTAASRHDLAADARTLTARAAAWRPWRSYAVQVLWASGDHPAATLPADPIPSATPPAVPSTIQEAS